MTPERLWPGTPEWDYYHHEHEQRYEFFSPLYSGLHVLDIACGVGYGSAIIAQAGAKAVLGVDVAAEAIEYARKHYERPGLTFMNASADGLADLGQTFDLIVSFETIEHLSDPVKFLREVHRVLRRGGRLICSTPNRNFSGKNGHAVNPYHLSEMSFQELSRAFNEYFIVEEQYHQSPSDAYRRHLQLVREFGEIARVVRFSKLLRIENRMRTLLGKPQLRIRDLSPNLAQPGPGDYPIVPLDHPRDSHLTFILVGRAKPRE